MLEATVDAHRADRGAARGAPVQGVDEGVVLQRAVQGELHGRREPRHDGERRPGVGRDVAQVAVRVRAQEAPVEREHLAVEPVERPEPEVAVLGELRERQVAVEAPVEQRVERRGLEHEVRLVLGVRAGPADRLDVQAVEQTVVDDVARLRLHGLYRGRTP